MGPGPGGGGNGGMGCSFKVDDFTDDTTTGGFEEEEDDLGDSLMLQRTRPTAETPATALPNRFFNHYFFFFFFTCHARSKSVRLFGLTCLFFILKLILSCFSFLDKLYCLGNNYLM